MVRTLRRPHFFCACACGGAGEARGEGMMLMRTLGAWAGVFRCWKRIMFPHKM